MTRGSERGPAIDGKAQRLSGPMGTINAAQRVTPLDTTSKFCGDCAKRLKARDDFFKFIFRRRDQYAS